MDYLVRIFRRKDESQDSLGEYTERREKKKVSKSGHRSLFRKVFLPGACGGKKKPFDFPALEEFEPLRSVVMENYGTLNSGGGENIMLMRGNKGFQMASRRVVNEAILFSMDPNYLRVLPAIDAPETLHSAYARNSISGLPVRIHKRIGILEMIHKERRKSVHGGDLLGEVNEMYLRPRDGFSTKPTPEIELCVIVFQSTFSSTPNVHLDSSKTKWKGSEDMIRDLNLGGQVATFCAQEAKQIKTDLTPGIHLERSIICSTVAPTPHGSLVVPAKQQKGIQKMVVPKKFRGGRKSVRNNTWSGDTNDECSIPSYGNFTTRKLVDDLDAKSILQNELVKAAKQKSGLQDESYGCEKFDDGIKSRQSNEVFRGQYPDPTKSTLVLNLILSAFNSIITDDFVEPILSYGNCIESGNLNDKPDEENGVQHQIPNDKEETSLVGMATTPTTDSDFIARDDAPKNEPVVATENKSFVGEESVSSLKESGNDNVECQENPPQSTPTDERNETLVPSLQAIESGNDESFLTPPNQTPEKRKILIIPPETFIHPTRKKILKKDTVPPSKKKNEVPAVINTGNYGGGGESARGSENLNEIRSDSKLIKCTKNVGLDSSFADPLIPNSRGSEESHKSLAEGGDEKAQRNQPIKDEMLVPCVPLTTVPEFVAPRQRSQAIFARDSYGHAKKSVMSEHGTKPHNPSFLLTPDPTVNKHTLLVDLDETLVHSSFEPLPNADFVVPVEMEGRMQKVYVAKRPFVDEFLQKMAPLYECVLFTASQASYADPVTDLLDNSGIFKARLFREACVLYRGQYLKDLSKLGRSLHRVILLDNSPMCYFFQPENGVPIRSWYDDTTDKELLNLIPFFERLSQVDNVFNFLPNSKRRSYSSSYLEKGVSHGLVRLSSL